MFPTPIFVTFTPSDPNPIYKQIPFPILPLQEPLASRCLGQLGGFSVRDIHLARVVQRMDNAIHRINYYPAGSVVCFVNTYPLDSDLSGE